MKTYTVNAEKHEGWWMLTSPDAPGAVSQVRVLSQAEDHAREAIAFVMDVDESDVEIRSGRGMPRK
ncbi:type II toxin-antitoxin system HicB family antitoxin [Knoellia sp. CPCC 206453]|uniref:type II toxin-antitoxin system HicB family antitoxin n=1 Tax=Knoellia pratensis TaxID=3404796 RepID=UPI00361BC400